MQLTAQLTLRPGQHLFSTTAARDAMPVGVKKKTTQAAAMIARRSKGVGRLKIKKKAIVKTGKPPLPGERKAMRKRIVLSNTNALPVQMEDLEKETLADKRLVGSVVGLPENVVDSLRAAEAFKPTQGWGLFRRPGILIREESVVLSERLAEVEKTKGSFRMVIDGDRVSGKSMMLLHAMTAAFLRGWIVVNIPDGQSSVNIQLNTS
jgi:small subunit ribosomal protein S29